MEITLKIMSKKIFKISGMDCDACAKMIELDLEDAGISCSCSYATQGLEVEINNKDEYIKVVEVIKKSGYGITDAS